MNEWMNKGKQTKYVLISLIRIFKNIIEYWNRTGKNNKDSYEKNFKNTRPQRKNNIGLFIRMVFPHIYLLMLASCYYEIPIFPYEPSYSS